MRTTGLARFIDEHRAKIIKEWVTFARSLLPAAGAMSPRELRDHADQILTAIIRDMKLRQTAAEQAEKSKGRGGAQSLGKIGQIHATLRIENGFKLGQMVAEYRALRASILRMWEDKGSDPSGVTRFNESIDEALTEAVESFMETTEHYRDQSLGILGHDLRNPLQAIIVSSELLARSPELGEKKVRIAARMLLSASRMNRMISDLLDLTRTRYGDQIPVVRTPMDLEPLCGQIVSELEGPHPTGRLSFTAKGNLQGEWDGDRIAQVLSNLVRNAIQHGGNGKVSVVGRGDADEVRLEVHNSGVTIPKSALATIFEPMVRHVGDDQKNAGLGLGLYIASQVALAHGGSLEATSTAAAGTTFTVHLPRHAPPKKTPRPPAGRSDGRDG